MSAECGCVRTLSFDQSEGSNCLYPGDAGGRPTCVNQDNSTILRDGILPVTTDLVTGQITGWGIDGSRNPDDRASSPDLQRGGGWQGQGRSAWPRITWARRGHAQRPWPRHPTGPGSIRLCDRTADF